MFLFHRIIIVMTLVMIAIGTVYDVIVHQKKIKNIEISDKQIRNHNNNGIPDSVENENGVADKLKKYQPNIVWKISLCFSLYTNTKSLFNTRKAKDSIDVVHGLKFISMFWIINTHGTTVFIWPYLGK